MDINLYQIDAFSQTVFKGNPAAVCPLDTWLSDDILQAIALENNLSETAFCVANASGFDIRWFTPTKEVNLCGHATLACAKVLFDELAYDKEVIVFQSKSGELKVRKNNDLFELDFPNNQPTECEAPSALLNAFASTPVKVLKKQDYIVVFAHEQDVINAQPDFNLLKQLDLQGVVITAPSTQYDFVSRFFAPNFGIDEDPVTGSSFTELAPYWAQQLNTTQLYAKQVSSRGGEVFCQVLSERVLISGHAVKYLSGVISLNL